MDSRDWCWMKRYEILRRSSWRGDVVVILSRERVGVGRDGKMREVEKSRTRDLVCERERKELIRDLEV